MAKFLKITNSNPLRRRLLGDAYEIRATALPVPVQLRSQNDPRSRSGDMILDCNLTLMSDTGFPVSAELYASLDTQGCVRKTHLRTDSLLAPRTAYYLIDINR